MLSLGNPDKGRLETVVPQVVLTFSGCWSQIGRQDRARRVTGPCLSRPRSQIGPPTTCTGKWGGPWGLSA